MDMSDSSLNQQFRELWSAAIGSPGYRPTEWRELQLLLEGIQSALAPFAAAGHKLPLHLPADATVAEVRGPEGRRVITVADLQLAARALQA